MAPYYSLWKNFCSRVERHEGMHLDFIVILETSLQYDSIINNPNILTIAKEPKYRDKEEYLTLIANDHGPGFHLIRLMDIVQDHDKDRPRVSRTDQNSYTRFYQWLVEKYAEGSGLLPCTDLKQATDHMLSIIENGFMFAKPLKSLGLSAMKARVKTAPVLSESMISKKSFLALIKELPFCFSFMDAIISFGDPPVSANIWGVMVQELSIIEGLALGKELRRPLHDLNVCCEADRHCVPQATDWAWNEDPKGNCNYSNIPNMYMKKLGIKSIGRHTFGMLPFV